MIVAVLTGNPYFAMLAAIGAMIPDLDRVYLLGNRPFFTGKETAKDEQWHRSLLHNLFFFIALYFISPWIALGAFLHSLQDALTTVEDRGVEWLFPLSRLVKRGQLAVVAQPGNTGCSIALANQNPPDKTSFRNEDTTQFTAFSDPQLRQPTPVPWRRTYGPALNGQLVDKWFFVGSLSAFVLFCYISQGFVATVDSFLLSGGAHIIYALLAALVVTYAGGWARTKNLSAFLYGPIMALSALLWSYTVFLTIPAWSSYRMPLNAEFAGGAAAILILEAAAIWRYSTSGGRKATV